MPDWKLEMQGEYEKYQRNGSYNIEQFYLALEKISKEHFSNGTMKDGDTFKFALSNGTLLAFTFNKDFTEISQIGINQNVLPLLRRSNLITSDKYKIQQSTVLSTIGVSLHATNDHIGEKFPEKLEKALKALTPGAIISFTDGRSYVCTGRPASNIIDLKQAYSGKIENLSLEALSSQKISLNTYDDIQLQRFYRDNQKKMTQRMEFNVSFTNKAKEFVELIERNVKYNEPHRIQMGNVTLMAKKNKDGSVIWFDGKGDRVSRDNVILLNGILNCGINERNYIRKNPTNMDIANDVNFEKMIENLSMGRKFEQIYNAMIAYVEKNQTNLAIESYQYEKNGEDLTPARIVFAERDGLVKAVKITYKDNDFAKEEDKITELSEKDFVRMCEQIYTANHNVLATRTEEYILNKLNRAKDSLSTEEREQLDGYINDMLKNRVKTIQTDIPDSQKVDVVSMVQGYMHENNLNELSANKIIEDFERDE